MSFRTQLLEFVQFLHTLGQAHFQALCEFVGSAIPPESFLVKEIPYALQNLSDQNLEEVLAATTGDLDSGAKADAERRIQEIGSQTNTTPHLLTFFGPLFQIFQLYELLRVMSVLQLMKLYEVIPSESTAVQCLQVLQLLQQLFGRLDPQRLLLLQQSLLDAKVQCTFSLLQPDQEQKILQENLDLPMEQFHLYQPLRMLLQLDPTELSSLQEVFPTLRPWQLYQLVELLQLQPFDVLEMRRVLVGEVIPINELPPPETQSLAWPQELATTQGGPKIKIVEQPPEQCIYKRNLKPNPVLMLVGETASDQNLIVTVTVVRCDEMTEQPEFITGNTPITVSRYASSSLSDSGRVATFRRLKMMVTSHQQNETLFLLKFDLRRSAGGNEEVLFTTFSNPIMVLSHSTQLKPGRLTHSMAAAASLPVIKEVVPLSGPTSGGTRVAILGSNFSDGPGTRVRFDSTDVMPLFHGPGTLICHTPQHSPGTVQVQACNDPRRWSTSSGSYTYEAPESSFGGLKSSIGLSDKFHLDINSTIQEAIWDDSYDQLDAALSKNGNVNTLDAFGYNALHYASAKGDVNLVRYLVVQRGLHPATPDARGNTALHWAIVYAAGAVFEELLSYGYVNLRNHTGATPLHLAAVLGNRDAVTRLLEAGAQPNNTDADGASPLHYSVVSGSTVIIATLVHRGAWVDLADDENETPLHWAVREQQKDAAETLLQLGASATLCNEDAENVFHLAAAVGDKAAIAFLTSVLPNALAQDLTKHLETKNQPSIYSEAPAWNGSPTSLDQWSSPVSNVCCPNLRPSFLSNCQNVRSTYIQGLSFAHGLPQTMVL